MITARAFAGRRYAVLGLARSGLATCEALIASGAGVTAWDEREAARDAAMALGADIGNPLEIDLVGFAGVVVSPGVPLNRHPIADHARAAGVPILGDIELFAEAAADLPPHRIVGITGTNGKSTTTALITHILETAGVPTLMGGNIGLPILGRDPLPAGGVYVLELSSYQIDLTYSLDCDVAVLLNITPDHLDRYESFEDYAASKLRLFAMQSAGRPAIIGDEVLGLCEFKFDRSAEDLWGCDREYPFPGQDQWPALQGPHNSQNADAAMAVASQLGLAETIVERALRTYSGLPHRMERVAEIAGVAWINDSKGTNTAATAPALAAFDNIHWIVGGLAKEPGLGECEAELRHVKAAYTIGKSGEDFAKLLETRVPTKRAVTLEQAVASAANSVRPGDTVLLSPACASFDQFRDFEHRGEVFRAEVAKLQGAAA